MVEENKEFSSDEYKLLIESFVTTDDIKLKLVEITELSEKRIADEEIKILLEEATKTKEFKETLKIIREN